MQRRQGYLEALDASDVAFDAALDIRVDFGFESAESATAKLLARGQDIDGIVATSDLIALGAIRALRKGGRMVPKDVPVVGSDDILTARLSPPPLTPTQPDPDEAGSRQVYPVTDS